MSRLVPFEQRVEPPRDPFPYPLVCFGEVPDVPAIACLFSSDFLYLLVGNAVERGRVPRENAQARKVRRGGFGPETRGWGVDLGVGVGRVVVW